MIRWLVLLMLAGCAATPQVQIDNDYRELITLRQSAQALLASHKLTILEALGAEQELNTARADLDGKKVSQAEGVLSAEKFYLSGKGAP